ncbi:MAG: DUF1460 domain-containing protein [Alphaproteobacteria bacterium]|nr:DUF1460 domain-containing protein [Alphaproteobacteria bacterium]
MRLALLVIFLLAGCHTDKIHYDGQRFLGAQYINSPLGEEKLPDTDPLIRFDAFDCTTFVETVLANGDIQKLNHIRYKNGKIDFLNRNHFIESDWLTNNADIVQNVTHQYGPTDVRTVTIDKKNWFKTAHNIYTEHAPETVHIEYLPYNNISKIQNKETLIVLFITDNPKIRDKIGTDLAVVHMGLLLPNGVLRHASSVHKQVIDVDFYEYINQQRQNKNNIGITLVAIK